MPRLPQAAYPGCQAFEQLNLSLPARGDNWEERFDGDAFDHCTRGRRYTLHKKGEITAPGFFAEGKGRPVPRPLRRDCQQSRA